MQRSESSQATPDLPPQIAQNLTDAYHQAFQERLLLAEEALRERCSHDSWHTERAKNDPKYWQRLAGGSPNLIPKRFIQRAMELEPEWDWENADGRAEIRRIARGLLETEIAQKLLSKGFMVLAPLVG